MVEQLPPVSSMGVRLRPQCFSTPNLAQHINLFLDSTATASPLCGAERPAGGPFASPNRRILIWGAPGVGKRRDLDRIVEAFEPDRAMLVSGSDVASGEVYERTIQLLRTAKQTGELVVLAVADYDAGGGGDRPSLFDASATSGSPEVPAGEPERVRDLPAQLLLPDERNSDRRGVLAMLRSSRTSKPSDASPAVGRILEAVRAEGVPALIVCTTSTNISDPHALVETAGLFDQAIYAPLPPFTSMEGAWGRVLAAVPLATDVRADELAALSEGLTAVDIEGVLRRAVTNMYLVRQRPLEDLRLAQADLLAALMAVKPLFAHWSRPGEPRRPDTMWSGIEERTRPTLPHVAADLERLGRGADTREQLGPEALRQAALGELSASHADGSEGGWDALLNGGLQ